jgi:hypothetical protein
MVKLDDTLAEACSVSDAQIDGQIWLLVKENRFDDDEL